MKIDPRCVAPPDRECRITVVIPARDEAEHIASALEALLDQCSLDGSRLDPRTYEIFVFCNDCRDETASIVRRFAARPGAPRIETFEACLPPEHAHVGTARRAILDLAVQRYLGVERPRAIVASTDADSRVDPMWIAWTLAEMHGVDAVAGHVEIAAADLALMLAPARLLYDRERTYRSLLGTLESCEDPLAHDPFPRHDAFVGTSFAVTAAAYGAAGGLASLRRLEDQDFARRLFRSGARVRHSYRVRVATSARRIARVDGGFARFLDHLHACGERRTSFDVLAARRSITEARARRAFRCVRAGIDGPAEHARIAEFFADAPLAIEFATRPTSFGRAFASALEFAGPRSYPDEPVDDAIAALRSAVTRAKAAAPALASTASGAG